MRSPTWPATAWSTTCRSASTRSNAAAPGDKGKGCDTFGPVGPWLVTADEVGDPQNLSMFLEVNGHRFQNGSTKTMIFGVAQLVSYVSRFMTLYPGDLISTGTPPGVGMGVKPNPVLPEGGDSIRLGIEKLGEQNQKVCLGSCAHRRVSS